MLDMKFNLRNSNSFAKSITLLKRFVSTKHIHLIFESLKAKPILGYDCLFDCRILT